MQKRGEVCKGDTWWLKKDDEGNIKKEACKVMCSNSTEENEKRYERMKNKVTM